MNKYLSRYLFYYPVTLIKGERVRKYYLEYDKLQWEESTALLAYHNKLLKELILHAYHTVPFYNNLYSLSGIDSNNIQQIAGIEKFPSISKSDIVSCFSQIHSSAYQRFSSSKTTGGSTGEAVTITKNIDALARERAATWVAYNWAGICVGDPQARFWGIPLIRKGKYFYKVVDFISNRIRLSAFNINDESLEKYYRKILKLQPSYFYGYVSMIVEFASFIKKKNYPTIPKLKCVITTSEVLDENTRGFIESVFEVKVFNEYGCGEVGSIAHECEYGSMHIMSDNLIVEVDQRNGAGNGDGEIVVTDLHNYSMPLIRYRLGDYATLSNAGCKCGRSFPIIKKIHGRAYDVIVDPDGNKHHPEIIMYIFEELKSVIGGVKQFQVIQDNVNHLLVKIVPDTGYDESIEREITKLLQDNIHPRMNSTFDYVEFIEREKSGKMRVIKSELS